jgi:hypothetical protein
VGYFCRNAVPTIETTVRPRRSQDERLVDGDERRAFLRGLVPELVGRVPDGLVDLDAPFFAACRGLVPELVGRVPDGLVDLGRCDAGADAADGLVDLGVRWRRGGPLLRRKGTASAEEAKSGHFRPLLRRNRNGGAP